jgi:S-adenosylmethionine-diacylgycerolhomoserine-N-methlytransferase
VLEVGCGTARNLLKLNKLVPGLKLYGLDASEEMLKTARKKVNNAGVDVKLVRVLAEELTPAGTFGRDEPFDHVFFSYALSMIPTWKESLEAASKSVKQGGAVWIVDFCDQKDLPGWFAKLLKWWLSLFHVAHKPELLEHLEELHRSGKGQVKIEFLYGRYCYIARYQPK